MHSTKCPWACSPLGQTPAAHQNAAALGLDLGAVADVVASGAVADHRSHPVVPLAGIAHSDGPCRLDQAVQQPVGDGVLDIDPRQGGALLAAQTEGRSDDAGDRPLEIAPSGHDAGIFSAHLGDAGTRIGAAGHLPIDPHADLIRAGERHPGEVGVVDQGLAHHPAGPDHVVEDAGRKARVADAVGEQPTRPRRGGRALEDDGVAGHKRRGHRAAAEGQGEVERHDHRPHAVGFQDAAVVREEIWQRIIRQDTIVALVLLVLRGVTGEEVRRLLGFAERLHAVLADLERERGPDGVHPLLDERGGSPDETDPLLVRGHPPGGKGPFGGGHRALDIRGPADRETTQHQALIDGAAAVGVVPRSRRRRRRCASCGSPRDRRGPPPAPSRSGCASPPGGRTWSNTSA